MHLGGILRNRIPKKEPILIFIPARRAVCHKRKGTVLMKTSRTINVMIIMYKERSVMTNSSFVGITIHTTNIAFKSFQQITQYKVQQHHEYDEAAGI
jgi:hypothetical protein